MVALHMEPYKVVCVDEMLCVTPAKASEVSSGLSKIDGIAKLAAEDALARRRYRHTSAASITIVLAALLLSSCVRSETPTCSSDIAKQFVTEIYVKNISDYVKPYLNKNLTGATLDYISTIKSETNVNYCLAQATYKIVYNQEGDKLVADRIGAPLGDLLYNTQQQLSAQREIEYFVRLSDDRQSAFVQVTDSK